MGSSGCAERLSYLLCATPRSGSTLLCDLLAATGIAGRPGSYFRRQSLAELAARLGVASAGIDRAYLDAVLRVAEAGTGVVGVRVMWESLGELVVALGTLYPAAAGERALLERAFGRLRFLHLSREDKVAQAVSRLRAEQSGLWHMGADGQVREQEGERREARYDAARIAAHVAALEAQDEGWRRWFAAQGITPVAVTYEALSRAPGEVLAEVLAGLGLDAAKAAGVAPRTARLADAKSEAWSRRFRRS